MTVGKPTQILCPGCGVGLKPYTFKRCPRCGAELPKQYHPHKIKMGTAGRRKRMKKQRGK